MKGGETSHMSETNNMLKETCPHIPQMEDFPGDQFVKQLQRRCWGLVLPK